ELLNEQKQAIIHQAVTRGLDPHVPLKPSGIDWLGDVPAHWDIRKLKFVAEEIVGGSTPSTGAPEYWDGDIVWVTPQDVSASATLVDSKRHITQRGLEACSSTLMPAGTIVVTSRAPVGNVAFAAIPLTTNQGCKAIIPERSRLDQRYAFRLLQVLKPELQSLAKGTTFTEISTTQIANVKVPVPPVDEQRSLVAVIASETQLTDQSIGLAEREIDLIREYRTRLIADVVTGKLDVRGVELPELDEAGDVAWDETDDELGDGEIEDDDIDD
ncbi:MAG TPA: restriction endonuclease subunit S, partial [Thermomicrobiales bacterium]|nr:restriction endonuclease subunit S [Thermomicrobiales bacterium]